MKATRSLLICLFVGLFVTLNCQENVTVHELKGDAALETTIAPPETSKTVTPSTEIITTAAPETPTENSNDTTTTIAPNTTSTTTTPKTTTVTPAPPTPDNTTTTVTPPTPDNTTTTVTPPTPDNSTTTSTTPATTTTTLVPPTPDNTTTPSPSPTPSTTPSPQPIPSHHFDGPSFIGGIVLTLGLLAIGLVAYKFYKARNERNYHTL